MPKSKDIKVTVKVDSKDLAKLYETIDDLRRRVEALESGTAVHGTLTVRTDARHDDVMDAIARATKLQSRGVKHARTIPQ